MNPSQPPANRSTGKPTVPPDQNTAYIPDIPESAFGFADESPTAQSYRPVKPLAAAAGRTALVPPVRPTTKPTPPPAAPSPGTAMPADVLPPQKVPATPTPTPPTAPAPTPTQTAVAAAAPVTAATQPTPATPSTASFSPTPVSHVPDDIAARLAEVPMQSSSDINKMITGKGTSRLKSILSILAFVIGIFAAAFLINQFVFQSYYVEGTSMTPTLQNNDRLIISKVERTLALVQGKAYIPERGQIVVLDSSIVGLNGQKEQLIKRVIGLPGDKIHIENGAVTITNAQFPSGIDIGKELGLGNLQATFSDSVIDMTIPQDQVYVMGDNRAEGGSYDSRSFGPIDGGKIQGRLWARILPFDKAQIF